MNGKISVLVLIYNNIGKIEDTLKTISMQKDVDIEVLLCDDCSNNYPAEVLQTYAKRFTSAKNIEIIPHRNINNVGTVRNIIDGIKRSTGDYIKIIAADDFYPDRNVFVRQLETIKKERAGVVVSRYMNCGNDNITVNDVRTSLSNTLLPLITKLDYAEGERMIDKYNLFPIATQACMFTKEFLFKIKCFDERYILIEDLSLSKAIRKNLNECCYLNDVSVIHRNGTGITSQNKAHNSNRSRKMYVNDMIVELSERTVSSHMDVDYWNNKLRLGYCQYLLSDEKHAFNKYCVCIAHHYFMRVVYKVRQRTLLTKLRYTNDQKV